MPSSAVAATAPERYFERLNEDFEAAAAAELHVRDLAVAGRRVRLRFAAPAALETLYPAVSHLAVPVDGDADIEFCIWDDLVARSPGAGFPWGPDDLTPRGTVRPLCDDRVHTTLEQLSGALICRHRRGRRLLCWLADAGDLPWTERSSPLRSAFGWALAKPSMPFVHAGCVGRDGAGVLIAGPSGSGKSVTSLACAAAGLDYAGDDYLFVELGETPLAHSLYCTARVHDYDVDRVPGLSEAVVGWVDGAGPKGAVDVRRLAGARLSTAMHVRALVLPVPRGDGPTSIRPAPPAEALRAMAPSSVFQVPQENPQAAFTALTAIARSLPAYVIELGGNAAEAARLIGQVCDGG